jgi:hypothetical protein
MVHFVKYILGADNRCLWVIAWEILDSTFWQCILVLLGIDRFGITKRYFFGSAYLWLTIGACEC